VNSGAFVGQTALQWPQVMHMAWSATSTLSFPERKILRGQMATHIPQLLQRFLSIEIIRRVLRICF
jgi:hypothetical protein